MLQVLNVHPQTRYHTAYTYYPTGALLDIAKLTPINYEAHIIDTNDVSYSITTVDNAFERLPRSVDYDLKMGFEDRILLKGTDVR